MCDLRALKRAGRSLRQRLQTGRRLVSALIAASLLCPLLAAAQINGPAVLLVAASKMTDPRFARTVILVTRHGRSPPLGVIINRPLGLRLSEVLPDPDAQAGGPSGSPAPPARDIPLFFGGPVGSGFLVYLFRSDEPPPADAIRVAPDVHFGRAASSLNELLNGARPHHGLRVFAGYAGWAHGQLEREIARGQWHVQAIDREYLFDKDIELIWPELHRRATQTTADLSPAPADEGGPLLAARGPAFLFPSLI